MCVVFVRTVVVALVVPIVVVVVVFVLDMVAVVLLCTTVICGVLLAVGEEGHAEKAEAVANHQTHLKNHSADHLRHRSLYGVTTL